MRKVCLIESEKHYEVVRNFALSIYGEVQLTIITNDFCISNLGKLADLEIDILSYEKELVKVNVTLQSKPFHFKLTITPPTLSFYRKHPHFFDGSDCLIHNMNYWLVPYQNIYFLKHPSFSNLKSLGRFIKYLPDLIKRRRAFKSVFKSYIAPSRSLYENYKHYPKLRTYIRLDYQGEGLETKEKSYFQIVIPGTVNSFRDYGGAMEVISEFAETSEKKVRLVLLGYNHLQLDVRKYESSKLEIVTFDSVISDVEYVQYLRTSDLGLLPLKEEVEHMGIIEKKGSSNISGGVNDLAYVGLRGLVPEFYRGLSELKFTSLKDISAFFSDLPRNNIRAIDNRPTISQNLSIIPNGQ